MNQSRVMLHCKSTEVMQLLFIKMVHGSVSLVLVPFELHTASVDVEHLQVEEIIDDAHGLQLFDFLGFFVGFLWFEIVFVMISVINVENIYEFIEIFVVVIESHLLLLVVAVVELVCVEWF
jgi:hypothetical protein